MSTRGQIFQKWVTRFWQTEKNPRWFIKKSIIIKPHKFCPHQTATNDSNKGVLHHVTSFEVTFHQMIKVVTYIKTNKAQNKSRYGGSQFRGITYGYFKAHITVYKRWVHKRTVHIKYLCTTETLQDTTRRHRCASTYTTNSIQNMKESISAKT